MEEISGNVERIIPLCLDPGIRSRHPKANSTSKRQEESEAPSVKMGGISDGTLPTNSNKNEKLKMNKASPAFASFLSVEAVVGLVRQHPVAFVFLLTLLVFMGVEYTIPMVPSDSPALDLGFRLTESLNAGLAERPDLNSFLAGLNTVNTFFPVISILYH